MEYFAEQGIGLNSLIMYDAKLCFTEKV